jgi:hypothetical protein
MGLVTSIEEWTDSIQGAKEKSSEMNNRPRILSKEETNNQESIQNEDQNDEDVDINEDGNNSDNSYDEESVLLRRLSNQDAELENLLFKYHFPLDPSVPCHENRRVINSGPNFG